MVFILVFEIQKNNAFANSLNIAVGLYAQAVLYFMAYKEVKS